MIRTNPQVMIYNGQLDLIINYPEVENFLSQLSWHGADSYRAAERHIWKVDGDVAGYVVEADNLVQVLVRNAGHMVPMDQPKWAFDMMQRFVRGKAFAASA
jgi:vitellogenic carboxypeptidase-like protein